MLVATVDDNEAIAKEAGAEFSIKVPFMSGYRAVKEGSVIDTD
jgi:hypothetical protein